MLGVVVGCECWNWILAFSVGIGCLHWVLALDIGISYRPGDGLDDRHGCGH